jgi:peroxiredoxin
MWNRRILPYIGLIGAGVLLFIFIRPSYREGQPSIAGRTAPNFPFTLDGHETHLSALRGKVVILNFWATWCPPCVAETPSLEQMYTDLKPLGVTVLGVSVDENATAYHSFIAKHDITFPTYRDPSKKIPLTYGTVMYPETYVIGRNGKIDRKLIGAQHWDSPHMLSYLRAIATGRRPTEF